MAQGNGWEQPNLEDADPIPGRVCKKCGEWKPAEAYSPVVQPLKRGGVWRGLASVCKQCKARPKVEGVCAHCGKSFVGRAGQRFCPSSRCCDAATSRRKTPPPEPVVHGRKLCSDCRVTKAVEEFPIHSTRRTVGKRCKVCHNRARRERTRLDRGLPADMSQEDLYRLTTSAPDGSTYRCGKYLMEKRAGHHRANAHGWVYQHILVAEEKYERLIPRGITVHHRNNDGTDNRPENLSLRVGKHGKHGDMIPTLLRHPDERAEAIAELLDHPDYRTELFAELAARGFKVLAPVGTDAGRPTRWG